jgi:hypothetical protein
MAPPDRAAVSDDAMGLSQRELLRARSGLTTEQLIYVGAAAGWLVVPGVRLAA